jgi:hypothetical protein
MHAIFVVPVLPIIGPSARSLVSHLMSGSLGVGCNRIDRPAVVQRKLQPVRFWAFFVVDLLVVSLGMAVAGAAIFQLGPFAPQTLLGPPLR